MGHLQRLKQEYRDLVGRLDRGTVSMPEPTRRSSRRGWQEILEILFTPEDAALASRLPVLPATLAGLSARLKLDPEPLRARLDAMACRGLVLDLVDPRTGETSYLLAPPVVGFFEFSLMRVEDPVRQKRLSEALEAYVNGDPAFGRELFGSKTQIGRALVHETALVEDLPEVLDYEKAESVIRDAKCVAVSICYCRHKAEHLGKACGAPKENCLSLNGGADFLSRRGLGRKIETSEALDILGAARTGGLVQIADNVRSQVSWVCNCCGCCCGQLDMVRRYGVPAVTPSGFQPRCDEARCSGCGRCARACPVGAIVLGARRERPRPRNALSPRVDAARCVGCGVCADACGKKALAMKRVSRPRVPANAVEKAVRQMLERGRLADLLFDAGAGLGPRALHAIVGALCALPPVQRLLASEQLQSRFVRQALRTVKAPL